MIFTLGFILGIEAGLLLGMFIYGLTEIGRQWAMKQVRKLLRLDRKDQEAV